MKALKSEELHALTTEELIRRETQYRESLFKMRMKLATGQLSHVADVTATRRNLARILTEMNRRTGE
ncbi:MAG TPA: 50S ribosomal protein L29 [Myxococcota bacterium]|jgi:ribosomal protein L29|nr:50S ribosomal protein L29 [Myxococcota bacterium]HOA13019.1 50S ribosomal protein L29 [Myxococcota bacterium]HOC98807.1 50S ribosomal protein L29 [Myxococcota bacterium]HOH75860.1 50S ribosomal protein L29 [Myxococcota bacterium]HPV03243.1 50S ribosomal protein L29 [Myxococcota bacterium]